MRRFWEMAAGALLGLLASAGTANAQLLARDLNSDGSIDAFYDVQQDISWLADANYYVTQGNPLSIGYQYDDPYAPQVLLPEGRVLHSTARDWVAGLNYFGIDDWRLPNRLIPAGTDELGYDDPLCGSTGCNPYGSWPSELSVLRTFLGGTAGPFLNVLDGFYMTAHEPYVVQFVNMYGNGVDGISDDHNWVSGHVWAVHDGDVGTISPVPEPSTYALMLSGLWLVLQLGRRRTRLAKVASVTT